MVRAFQGLAVVRALDLVGRQRGDLAAEDWGLVDVKTVGELVGAARAAWRSSDRVASLDGATGRWVSDSDLVEL